MEVLRQNTDILRASLAKIQKFIDDDIGEEDETDLILILSTFEQLFGQEFWKRAKRYVISILRIFASASPILRLTNSKILEGTSFRFRWETVSKNSNVFTERGKGRLLIKHFIDAHLLTPV